MRKIQRFKRSMALGWVLVFGLGLLGVSLTPLSQAQTYPTKAVKLINSFPPGGPSDVISRLLGEYLQSTLKQPFVVENRAGLAAIWAPTLSPKAHPTATPF